MALDLDSGKIKWYHQLGGYDVWFFGCNNILTPNCSPSPKPDANIGEAPLMVSMNSNNTKVDIVVDLLLFKKWICMGFGPQQWQPQMDNSKLT